MLTPKSERSPLKHYQSDLNSFIETSGDKKPEMVTAADIDDFIDQQRAAELKPSTINRRLATLHSFFEYLASEKPEVVWPNPVNWRRHQLKTGSHLPRDVSDEEVERLFGEIDDERDQAIFGLMVDAGLRVGEVVTLVLSSLEGPSGEGQLAKLRVKGKGNKERLVWLTDTLWGVLERWLKVSAQPRLRPRTFEGYEQIVERHLIPRLGKIPLQKLTPQHVQQLLTEKSSEGLSPRRVGYIRAVLRTALNQALRWNLVAWNVATLVDTPPGNFLDNLVHKNLRTLLLQPAFFDQRIKVVFGLQLQPIRKLFSFNKNCRQNR